MHHVRSQPMALSDTHSRNRFITEDDRQASTDTMVELGQLKSRHLYLELLYVRWYDRFSRMGVFSGRGSPEDQQMPEELLPGIRSRPRDSLIRCWTWAGQMGQRGVL
jgi:hypothetical protein